MGTFFLLATPDSEFHLLSYQNLTLMKNLSFLFLIFVLICSSFSASAQARRTAAVAPMKAFSQSNDKTIIPTKVRLRTKRGYKVVDYVPANKLQEGRNFVRFGQRRLFVQVRSRKVVSVRVMNRVGQWGPNVLATQPTYQAFWCVGGICGCSGDSDCNDMFTSTVCGDAAVCVDDKCYCVMN